VTTDRALRHLSSSERAKVELEKACRRTGSYRKRENEQGGSWHDCHCPTHITKDVAKRNARRCSIVNTDGFAEQAREDDIACLDGRQVDCARQ
jgi:hypothetical protein